MSTATYPKCVADKIAEIDAERAKVEAMAELGRVCEEVAAMFPGTFIAIPNIGKFTHYMDIRMSLDEVVPLIREYRKRGIKVIKHEDRPDHACREYYLEGVSVYVSLPRDSSAPQLCKFVQTGTREVPVYELKCEKA